jgi:hypothetical protein
MTSKEILDIMDIMDKNIQLVVSLLKKCMGIAESALHLDELSCFASREMFTNQSLEDIHISFKPPTFNLRFQ